MWKALINWINSKSYRCEHNWEKLTEHYTYEEDSNGKRDELPIKINHIYRCTKCCEFKSYTLK